MFESFGRPLGYKKNNWWTRLWCTHIWEKLQEYPLNRKERQLRLNIVGEPVITGRTVEKYAVSYQCIKCEHLKVVEEEKEI